MKTLLLHFLPMLFYVPLLAQTYATPELKEQEETHKVGKNEWIKNNPKTYREQGGNTEEVLNSAKEKNGTQELDAPGGFYENKYRSPVNIDDPNLYKLVGVRAVDVNNKHTTQEMEDFELEAEGEYDKANIIIDLDKNLWFLIPRDSHYPPASREIRLKDNRLEFVGCTDCEQSNFRVVEHTTSKLVVQLHPQDEGQYFMYLFEFKK